MARKGCRGFTEGTGEETRAWGDSVEGIITIYGERENSAALLVVKWWFYNKFFFFLRHEPTKTQIARI